MTVRDRRGDSDFPTDVGRGSSNDILEWARLDIVDQNHSDIPFDGFDIAHPPASSPTTSNCLACIRDWFDPATLITKTANQMFRHHFRSQEDRWGSRRVK